MIGDDGRQGGAAPLHAPEAPKGRRGASYTLLAPLIGPPDLPTTGAIGKAAAMAELAVQMNVTNLDVYVRHSDGTIRDPIIVGIVDLHTGQVIGFCQGTNASILVRRVLAEMILARGLPTRLVFGEGCDAAVAIAVHEELRAHGCWSLDLLTASPAQEGRNDD